MFEMMIAEGMRTLSSSKILSTLLAKKWVIGLISLLDYTSFLESGVSALKVVIIAVGGGLAILGMVNLLEGYGNDNPGAKLPGTDDREQDSFGDMESFRKKTEELFHLIDGMTAGALEEQVLDHVRGVLADYGEEAEAEVCAVTGSRCRGLEQDGSDVDVVVEVRGEGVREETLLEMLRSDWVTVGGVRVDIHPIVSDPDRNPCGISEGGGGTAC